LKYVKILNLREKGEGVKGKREKGKGKRKSEK
jgi:hypothetical protein